MKKQEIWIKIDSKNQSVDEVMKFILSLTEDDLLGEIPVIIYYSDTRAIKRLSHIYDVDISAVNVFREKYGDDNVKFAERTIEAPVTVTVENQLERIADSLEVVIDALQTIGGGLEPLSKCVGYIPPNRFMKEGYHFLRIGGDVDTGNY